MDYSALKSQLSLMKDDQNCSGFQLFCFERLLEQVNTPAEIIERAENIANDWAALEDKTGYQTKEQQLRDSVVRRSENKLSSKKSGKPAPVYVGSEEQSLSVEKLRSEVKQLKVSAEKQQSAVKQSEAKKSINERNSSAKRVERKESLDKGHVVEEAKQHQSVDKKEIKSNVSEAKVNPTSLSKQKVQSKKRLLESHSKKTDQH